MSDEEIAFDDWEKEAELIVISKEEEAAKPEEVIEATAKDNPEQPCDPLQQHLAQMERIKNMDLSQFQAEFCSGVSLGGVQPFSALLKAEREFSELASSLGVRFRSWAKQCPGGVLPESETVGFFEEFLLYLHPELQWESIEAVKEKTKIVKKEKKEEEARLRKLREKELRLKRGFNKQEDDRTSAPNKAQSAEHEEEGM